MDPQITIVGLGPGGIATLPVENLNVLEAAEVLFLRTERHPAAEDLKKRGVPFKTYDHLYDRGGSFQEIYTEIARDLVGRTSSGPVVYAVPGHPMVAEASVSILIPLCHKQGLKMRVLPAMSFLDSVFALLALDPGDGLHIIDALQLDRQRPDPALTNVIVQVYNRLIASDTKLSLMDYFPDEHPVKVIRAAGVPGEEQVVEIPLYELDRLAWIDHLTTVAVPPLNESAAGVSRFPADRLVGILEMLRSETGCPWDREQTHDSLKKYLVEETYEVIEAIDEGNMYKICEELGDLLLQIVFHAQIARESGYFDFNDIVQGISQKLIRRHPHVFGEVQVENSAQVSANWEQIKAGEKAARGEAPVSVLDGIPRGLPALAKAEKIQKKAAKVGFDWPDYRGAMEKVEEELAEFKQALNLDDRQKLNEEIGDMLFAVVNLARLVGVDPENALGGTIGKFCSRFRYMEEAALTRHAELRKLSLEELDNLWEEAKKSLNQ
ncbi:MAG: nucleoside triphosphate pyrophosphohydrolase [Bacillota bacterium]